MTDLATNYLILWASQTGTAEQIAKNIHSEAAKKNYSGECVVMDDFKLDSFNRDSILILISSNTGDGDEPDNAIKFWENLKRINDKEYFVNIRFTVLGLGDSSYDNFNNTGRRLEKKFKELGATVFHKKGLADDYDNLELVVDSWVEKLWEVLPTVLQQNTNESIEESVQHEKEIEKQMTELLIDDPASIPFSRKDRKKNLPSVVEKYTHLENSMVEKSPKMSDDIPDVAGFVDNAANNDVEPQLKEMKKGHPLSISLSGLEQGTKLTGLPRVSVPVAKLTAIEGTLNRTDKVPDFFVTPTPITYAPITMVSCLTTADAMKRTLEVELDIGRDNHFDPGDAFGIVAPNNEELVQAILHRLGVSHEDACNKLYTVEGGDKLPSHLQKAVRTTLIDLFRYAIDLASQPRKALFRMLADSTTDPKEKLTLMYMCSKQGAPAFNAVRDACPTLLDILATFPNCQPSIDRLLDLLPAHQPRLYSISSSLLKHPDKIRFAFNVVKYHIGEAERQGVATPWMDQLTGLVDSRNTAANIEHYLDGSVKVPMFIRINHNAFVLPLETERPLVLIGPGTGIAPFIGFLEHRQQQRLIRQGMGGIGHRPAQQVRDQFGPIHVYYGFREKNKDFLFQKELEAFEKDKTISKLCLAESRKPDESKVYVQDLIRRDAKELYTLICEKDAAIYVCGDAKGMAKGVQDALVAILVEYHNLDTLEASKLLMSWIESKKYLRDLWA